MKKVAIIGTGTVGQTFASRLVSLGHDVMMGTRDVADICYAVDWRKSW